MVAAKIATLPLGGNQHSRKGASIDAGSHAPSLPGLPLEPRATKISRSDFSLTTRRSAISGPQQPQPQFQTIYAGNAMGTNGARITNAVAYPRSFTYDRCGISVERAQELVPAFLGL
jgi:hypothetical protein